MTDQLYFEVRENGVGLLQIHRPEALNALNRTIVDELEELADRIAEDPAVKALIIGGTECFAAGADIKDMVECNPERAKAFAFSPTFNKLEALAIPTIAALDGFALGGGLELALTCDLRIAAETAKMGFPEINLGIMPGAGGTARLPRLVGEARAKELIFFGSQITAQKAEAMGLVNLVVGKEELLPTALNWAEKLSKKAPIALKTAKASIRRELAAPSVIAAVAMEEEAWSGLFATEDQKEGMRAFLEKRKPTYFAK